MTKILRNTFMTTAIASSIGLGASAMKAVTEENINSNIKQEMNYENASSQNNDKSNNKVTQFLEDSTAPNTMIPWGATLPVSLAGLGFASKNKKDIETKIDSNENYTEILKEEDNILQEVNLKNFPLEYIEEETKLSQEENGKMPNRLISKQTKFMQYAIEHLKEIGDEINLELLDNQGTVKIKKVNNLYGQEKGARLAKIIEKNTGEKVIYDINLLEYPEYNRKEIYFNRMFEYKNDTPILEPYCCSMLYDRETKNGFITSVDYTFPTSNGNIKNFLNKI